VSQLQIEFYRDVPVRYSMSVWLSSICCGE